MHRIELGLGAYDLQRLAAGLEEEAMPGKLDDGFLVIVDDELAAVLEARYERLMRLNRAIHARARRAGSPIRPYKPLDRVNLLLAILAANDVPSLAHEVIWRQPFSNANHRTAIAAVEEELGIVADDATLAMLDPILATSKTLLDGSDDSRSDQEAKTEHQALMVRLVETLQSRS